MDVTMALHTAVRLVGGEVAEKASLMVVEMDAEMVEFEAEEMDE